MTSLVNLVNPTGHMAAHNPGGGSSVPYRPVVPDPEQEQDLDSSSNAADGSSAPNDVAKASAVALAGFSLVEDFWYNNNYWCMMDGSYPFADIAFLLGTAGASLYALGEYIAYAVSNSDLISNAINNFGGGNAAMPPSNPDNGFRSFRQLKKYLGSAGEGNQWHHIVEQS